MGINYVKCPRCNLNWIPDNEQYCDICKKALHMSTNISLIGDEFDEDESLKLCPYCHMNYIEEGEEMCMQCRADMHDSLAAEGEKEKWDSSMGDDENGADGEDMSDWGDGALDVTPEDEEMIVEEFEDEDIEEEEEDAEKPEEEKEEDGYGDDFDDMFLDEEFEDEGEEDEEDNDDDDK